MPKGSPLTDSQRRSIYNMHCLGETNAEIAEAFGVTPGCVGNVVRRQRREVGEAASRERVVAGDRRGGCLESTSDPHRFEGTCVIRGRKSSRSFVTVNAAKATEMWERWCDDLRAEDDFMRMVERKEPEVTAQACADAPANASEALPATEEQAPKVASRIEDAGGTSAPATEAGAESWRQVAEELEAENAKLRELVERLQDRLDGYESTTQLTTSGPAYLLWVKGDTPRAYGLYDSMEDALGKVDEMNEVAEFLGSGSAFEVDEVQWR